VGDFDCFVAIVTMPPVVKAFDVDCVPEQPERLESQPVRRRVSAPRRSKKVGGALPEMGDVRKRRDHVTVDGGELAQVVSAFRENYEPRVCIDCNRDPTEVIVLPSAPSRRDLEAPEGRRKYESDPIGAIKRFAETPL
jgi:hypothetical protein